MTLPYDPYDHQRRKTTEVINIGSGNVPRVVADLSAKQNITPASFFAFGYSYSVPMDKWNLSDMACDYIFVGSNKVDFQIPGTLGLIYDHRVWHTHENKIRTFPLFSFSDYQHSEHRSAEVNFVSVSIADISNLDLVKADATVVLVLETNNQHGMAEQRRVFVELMNKGISNPVIIKRTYKELGAEKFQLQASTDVGALLLDGMGDGVWLTADVNDQMINSTAFGILQATRSRISKTEYISCPSCGRTLFDLQETTAKIRKRTDHLKGVKIGIMGCIVNGPGEMADADYGYVGTGVGKITLYKGREVVERNINSEKAVDALIELIKKHGDWVDKV